MNQRTLTQARRALFDIIGAVILLGVSADELVKRLSARRRALEESRAKASKQG
jgi:deoxyadenosine/deoxycytidine kinase